MEIELSHDDLDAKGPQEGPRARSRDDADHSAEDADRQPPKDNVSGGNDAVGDTHGSLAEQHVAEELAEAEEILEGELDEASPPDEVIEGELVGRRLKEQLIHEKWKAPLPPPKALREYEDICPGAADRVLRMAERQIDIRETRESTLQKAVVGEVEIQTILAEGDRDALQRGQYLAAAISGLVALLSFGGMFLTPWAAVGFTVPLAQVAAVLVRTITDGHGDQKVSDQQETPADAPDK